MTEIQAGDAVTISAKLEQRVYPAYHPLHGTPSPMLWRKVTIITSRGEAAFEQTDYGHPGRVNPWEPRGVANALTSRLSQLLGVAEALRALQDAS